MSKPTVGIAVAVVAFCVASSLGAEEAKDQRDAAHDFFGGFEDTSKVVIDAASTKEGLAPMRLMADPKAARGKSLQVPSSKLLRGAKPDGHALFEFDVEEEGKYCLHVRAHWPGPASLPNRATSADRRRSAVFVSLDGGKRLRLAGRTMAHRYWMKVRGLFHLRKGKHTLKIAILGHGVRLDQILLTADKEYVPQGIEK